MKKSIKNIAFLVLAASLVTLSSCKKEEIKPETEVPADTNGSVAVKLTHKWGMESELFEMNKYYTHPMNGDSMSFTTYKYYISNFKLKKADGTWWVHPESYFLVDLSNPASETLDLGQIPSGEYTEMEYTLGVDSLRNVSGAQTGALSTTNNMFWSWNSGYVMVKAEGLSPNASTGSFAFHLGGFKGEYNVVTVKNVSFSSNNLTISSGKKSEIHLNVNPAMTWCTSGSCSGTSAIMMPGALAKQLATDFYSGFVFDHIVE